MPFSIETEREKKTSVVLARARRDPLLLLLAPLAEHPPSCFSLSAVSFGVEGHVRERERDEQEEKDKTFDFITI